MSVQATTWVWGESKAEGVQLLVALAVADAANAQGERSCQSVATMSAMTRVSERTVQRALRALEEAGEIATTGTDPTYRTKVYRFPRMDDKRAAARVTDQAAVGDTVVSPYPKDTQLQPQNPSADESAPGLFAVPDAPSEKDAAKLILEWWWQHQDPKPAGKGAWHGGLAAIRALVKAGHDPKAVQDAVMTLAPPLSIPRIEIALDRARPARGKSTETYTEHWNTGGGFTNEGTT